MRIAAFSDWRFAHWPAPTGVGKHMLHMLRGLSERYGEGLFRMSVSDQLAPLPNGFPQMATTRIPFSWRIGEVLWTATGRPFADGWCGRADWVYCPKNDFIPIRNGCVAVTVHGAHELDPSIPQAATCRGRAERLCRHAMYSRALRRADRILTVSHFLKSQVIDWFGVEPEKIVVVGNGIEAEFFEAGGQLGETTEPILLCVGGLNYLDGGDRILGLAELLQKELPEFEIQVAGANHEGLLAQRAANLANVRLLGYVRSTELAERMRSAFALLFPTRYETFGIPAVEALAAGLPVITCKSTAVPEIVGDAALYAENADDAHEVMELVRELRDGPEVRERLISRGRKRAKRYTWAGAVERLVKALSK